MVNPVLNQRYHLLSKIAQGDICTVFRAMDLQQQTEKAVKILHPQLRVHPTLTQLFLNLNQQLLQSGHQSVAVHYESAIASDMPYVVMEFLPGGNLINKLATNGPLHPQLAIQAIIDICHALDFAHQQNRLHLSVSPHNMMLSQHGVIKLCNFGMYRLEKEAHRIVKIAITNSTVPYLPPEQELIQSDSIHCDLYGAAASLYTLLTNQRPDQLYIPRLQNKKFSILPDPIKSFLASACAANPNERFHSAQEMAAELKSIAQYLPEIPHDSQPLFLYSDDTEDEDLSQFEQNYKEQLKQHGFELTHPLLSQLATHHANEDTTLPPDMFIRNIIPRRVAVSQSKAEAPPLPSEPVNAPKQTKKIMPSEPTIPVSEPPSKSSSLLLTVIIPLIIILALTIYLTQSTGKIATIDMIVIPKGSFYMGSIAPERPADERPLHQVHLHYSFYIAKTEVTQAMWETLMDSNLSHHKDCPTCPAESLSWYEAAQFANALSRRDNLETCYQFTEKQVVWPQGLQCKGYRLPTEAEWEAAARGMGAVNQEQRLQFAGSNDIASVGWYTSNANETTHPVCMKQKNAHALCDMTGNVAEWVWDFYGDYGKQPQTNPTGPPSGKYRLIRGGSFGDSAARSTVAFRSQLVDEKGYYPKVGFRLVRTKEIPSGAN